jgi:YVTN family beta-propeller protein
MKTRYVKFAMSFAILILILIAFCNATKKSDAIEQTQSQSQTNVEEKAHFYYTANESGSISKIDAKTNKVIKTIEDEGLPHNIQVSPDGKVVAYTSAAKIENNQIDNKNINGFAIFYDVDTDNLIRKVEVGKNPAHIVFTNDGKNVLVTNSEDDNVSIIDAKTYEVVNNVQVGKGPHGFRISKDNKFAYIANMGEDTVSVVDIDNKNETMRIKVGDTPVTTGITSNNKVLVVTISKEHVLAIIDLATSKGIKVPVGRGPAQVYIQPDGKYAFIANQGTEEQPSSSLSKIDLRTRKVVATTKTGNGCHGVVVSPDNKLVYVTNLYDGTVSVIDNAKDKVIKTVQVGEKPYGISFR